MQGDNSQHRLNNDAYDSAGNMTGDGLHTYGYDAENRLVSIDNGATSYGYGPEGNRVATWSAGAVQQEYLYDLSGNLATTLDGSGNLVTAALQGGGMHFADYSGSLVSGNTTFREPDQVGSLLTTWDQTGQATGSCLGEPFGGDLDCAPSTDYDETHFTDKQRDQESGLDYFGARYYASNMGRFTSPDSVGGDPENPQSWNLYSYAYNNPLTNTDPDGHEVQVCTSDTSGGQHCSSSIDNGVYDSAAGANNGGLNVPSLQNLEQNGSGNITNANGNVVGTATYTPGSGLEGFANQQGSAMIGFGGQAMVNAFMENMAYTVAGGLAGNAVGMGVKAVTAGRTARAADVAAQATSQSWKFGAFKSSTKWANQLLKRGWTESEITETIARGERYTAPNSVNPANGATRYVSPTSGKSVVVDNVTNEVIHVGGEGFRY